MSTLREQLAAAKAEVDRLKKMTRCPREPLKGWIGGIIQQRREALGWNLHDLARKSGVATGLVSRFESNIDANPTLNNLLKIAKALGAPLSQIMEEWEKDAAALRSLRIRKQKEKR